MTIEKATKIAISMVPSWYQGSSGNYGFSLVFQGYSTMFYSFRNLTPKLRSFYNYIQANLFRIINQNSHLSEHLLEEVLQEELVLYWLSLQPHADKINWSKLFNYDRKISNQTNENNLLARNIVFSDETGSEDLLTTNNKSLEQIGSTAYTYISVDSELRCCSINTINYENRIRPHNSYQFLPEFLMHNRHLNSFSYHKTTFNDMIILNHYSLCVTKRKGKFTIYDVETLKNSFVDIIGDYNLGCNLFEIIFDLSYKRKGALLVYDPNNSFSVHTTNINSEAPTPFQSSIISQIQMRANDTNNLKKDLIIELASIDGALIFNTESVTSYNTMIISSQNISGIEGSRLLAAKSAQEYGYPSILISSDGLIKIFFHHNQTSNNLEFY